MIKDDAGIFSNNFYCETFFRCDFSSWKFCRNLALNDVKEKSSFLPYQRCCLLNVENKFHIKWHSKLLLIFVTCSCAAALLVIFFAAIRVAQSKFHDSREYNGDKQTCLVLKDFLLLHKDSMRFWRITTFYSAIFHPILHSLFIIIIQHQPRYRNLWDFVSDFTHPLHDMFERERVRNYECFVWLRRSLW